MLHSVVVHVTPYPRRAPRGGVELVRVKFLLISPVHFYVSASGVASPPPLLCVQQCPCGSSHVAAAAQIPALATMVQHLYAGLGEVVCRDYSQGQIPVRMQASL